MGTVNAVERFNAPLLLIETNAVPELFCHSVKLADCETAPFICNILSLAVVDVNKTPVELSKFKVLVW